jgi:hypothetical protein
VSTVSTGGLRLLVRAAAFASGLALIPGQNGYALSSGAQGSCLLAPAKLTDSALKSFKDRPQELLRRHPEGGAAMSAEVRRLAGSDLSTVALLIELARGQGEVHVVAIAIGLAQATMACSRVRAELGQLIKQEVSQSGFSELSAAFAASMALLEVTEIPPPPWTPRSETARVGNLRPAGGGETNAAPGVGGSGSTSGFGSQALYLSGDGTFSATPPPSGRSSAAPPSGTGFAPPPRASENLVSFGTGGVTSTYGSSVSPTR